MSVLPGNNKIETSHKHRVSFKSTLTQKQAGKDTMHTPVRFTHNTVSALTGPPTLTRHMIGYHPLSINVVFPGKPDVDYNIHKRLYF